MLMKQEGKEFKKNLLDTVKKMLGMESGDVGASLPGSGEEEIAESAGNLISKATGEKLPGKEKQEAGDNNENNDNNDNKKNSCPYATKRAIVASLQEVRRFAEEHNLGAAMVKTLLTFLAEMALDALKGKVTGKVLEAILKAFNYESAVKDAYKEGKVAGKNSRIETELFPETEMTIPRINGTVLKKNSKTSIFDIADGVDQ